MTSKKQDKLIVVCGPTATGKTALAIKLAKEFSGEIISADSRQVYRGMDIGTDKKPGKGTGKQGLKVKKGNGFWEIDGVKIWLYDVVEPNEEFSVAQYQKLAYTALVNIWQRGKLPFVVGGTGLYIRALIDGVETLDIPPDWKLRKDLRDYTVIQLQKKLEEIFPERIQEMNNSDRQNPRRLIRAIEITMHEKQSTVNCKKLFTAPRLNPLFIGLTAPKEILYKKADERIEAMINDGLEQEVRNLVDQGCDWDRPAMSAIGYSQWRAYFEQQSKLAYFDKKSILEDTVQRIKFETHAFICRQLTWFKHDNRINWFDTMHVDCYDKIKQTAYEHTKN